LREAPDEQAHKRTRAGNAADRSCLDGHDGIGAAAIDLGYANYQQMRMQSASDAAALAGARALIGGGCPDQTDAATAANSDSTVDNFKAGSNVTVTVDNPPAASDGSYASNPCAVAVTITVPHNADWFLKFLAIQTAWASPRRPLQ
jgi:Flp pilus assembly protein TadG